MKTKKLILIFFIALICFSGYSQTYSDYSNVASGTTGVTETPECLQGLVAAWEMDETTRPALVDETGNTTGTIAAVTLINQTGSPSAAHTYDGTVGLYDTVNDNDVLSSSTSLYLSTWIKPTNLASNRHPITKNLEYSMYISSTGVLNVQFYENGTASYVRMSTPAGSIVLNANHHIVVNTLDLFTPGLPASEMCEIWIDGVSVALTSTGIANLTLGMANTTNPLKVGGFEDVRFYGSISQLWRYDQQLTSDKIAALYNGGNGITYEEASGFETFLSSADYYVSSSVGDDLNDGLTPETAWATLAKVDATTIPAGSVVALKAGDEWHEDLYINNAGTSGNITTYSAYGTGLKPKIYGSTEITGWTLHSGNIYKATVGSAIKQLFVDGDRINVSRVPNTGYYYPTSVASGTQFTSTSLDGGINYTGATCLFRAALYRYSSTTVTSSTGQTINLSADDGIRTTEGFILMNHVNLIDQAGEWAYDSSTGTVYVWLPDGSDPSTHTMTASTEIYGVYVYHSDYINIENLDIRNASDAGVRINNANYVSVKNCNLANNAVSGIQVGGGTQSNITIENNTISKSGSHGINNGSSNSTIKDNTITDIGVFDEFGIASTNQGIGINVVGGFNSIFYNKIENTGYNGISFIGESTMISYNLIDSTNVNLDDGGGIYTIGHLENSIRSRNSVISYNIILNNFGNRVGYDADFDQGMGIYLDGHIYDVTIENNTLAHNTTGILANLTNEGNIIRNNTVIDSGVLLSISGTVANTVTGNVAYATENLYDYVWWTNSNQRLVNINYDGGGNIHTFDNNKYYNHYSTTNLFKNEGVVVGSDFSAWQAHTGQEANSTLDTSPLGAGEVEELFYNDTKTKKAFKLTESYRDLDGNAIGSLLVLEPFTSKILIKE